MPTLIDTVLRSRGLALAARIVLTFPFWGSGLSKLIDFQGGVGEMAQFGLQPAAAFNVAVILVQLGGSALVIADRRAWLGAGALGVFTALTIPVVHHFWSMTQEPFRTIAFHTATEHVGMIGALVLAAILSSHRRRDAAADRPLAARLAAEPR
jgi:transmembrane protein